MLTEDLKTIIELMEVAGGTFTAVKIKDYKAYATNGKALVIREVQFKEEGFIRKEHLPILKGVLARDKKLEFTDGSLGYYIDEGCNFSFPSTEQMDSVFNSEFKYEINFDANDLIKALKSLKSKDNSVIIKIKDNASPFLVVHENGKAIIAPKKN